MYTLNLYKYGARTAAEAALKCIFSFSFKGMFRNVFMCVCMFVATNKNEDVSKIL